MELYLKKYFWVIHVLVIATCAVLLAKGVNHYIEARWLIGEGKAHKAHKATTSRPAAKPAPKPVVKDSDAVALRNIFCSECEPPQPVATTPGPQQVSDPNNPPATSLPLVLMATSVARDPNLSSATIQNTLSNKSGSYWVNDEIPGAGPIKRIQTTSVDFQNTSAGRLERILLAGIAAPPPKVEPVAAPATQPATPEGDFVSEVEKGVKKIDDTHYEIDRGLVDKVLGDPNLVARAARIVPSIKDGKSNGFKMYAIRPNSVYAKIGFQNGDTIHSVNGFEITSPDKALEVYTKVKSATSLSISLTRRGQPVNMEYSIK